MILSLGLFLRIWLSKRGLFSRPDTICAPSTILATNTSTLFVEEMARVSGRPDRFAGLHFFYHSAEKNWQEIIPRPPTLPESISACGHFSRLTGKKAIVMGATGEAFVAGEAVGVFVECITRKRFVDNVVFARHVHEVLNRIDNCLKLVVPGMGGMVFGGRFKLAVSADMIVATPKAVTGFTGRLISAEEAHLNEIFSTADALSGLTSIGKCTPTFQAEQAIPISSESHDHRPFIGHDSLREVLKKRGAG